MLISVFCVDFWLFTFSKASWLQLYLWQADKTLLKSNKEEEQLSPHKQENIELYNIANGARMSNFWGPQGRIQEWKIPTKLDMC